MKNIVLIGMPASGKSTIGVVLAKTLGVGFVDTDLIIQQREKRLLQDIINTDGLEKFLDCERDAIISQKYENCVISTGGSAVFRADAMQYLKKDGIISFEIGKDQRDDVIRIMESFGIGNIKVFLDINNIYRVVVGEKN